MYVKNLQEFLENFTSKKGNAITNAKIIGEHDIKLVVKTQDEQLLKIDEKLKENY